MLLIIIKKKQYYFHCENNKSFIHTLLCKTINGKTLYQKDLNILDVEFINKWKYLHRRALLNQETQDSSITLAEECI